MSTFDNGIVDDENTHQQEQRTLETIPQITLTPVSEQDTIVPLSPTTTPVQLKKKRPKPPRPPPISTSLSLPKLSKSPKSASPTATTTPLPLTRDLLQRKNKLDKLTHERQNTFNSPIDERVTQGLGITLPSLQTSATTISSTTTNSVPKPNIVQHLNPFGHHSHSPSTSPPLSPNSNNTHNYPHRRHRRQLSSLDLKTTTISSSSSINELSSGIPLSPNQKQQLQYQPIPPPPLLSLSNSHYYHFTYNHSTLHHQQQGKYSHPTTDHHYMGARKRKLQQQQQQQQQQFSYGDTSFPSLYFQPTSSVPGLAEKILFWLYEAADRVVHARAPESKAIAYLETDDLLLLSTTTVQHEQQQQPISPTYFDEKKIDQPLSPTPSTLTTYMNEKKDQLLSSSIDPNILDKTDINNHSDNDDNNKACSQYYELLQGRSLRYFSSSKHSVRFYLWKHLIRSRNYEVFMLMVLIFHWLILACHPIYDNAQKTVFHGHWHEYTILLIQIIYTLDCVGKIIVYGLWIPPDNRKSGYHLLLEPLVTFLTSPWTTAPMTKKALYEDSNPISNDNAINKSSSSPSSSRHTMHHKAYLNSFGNGLDFVSVICYWVDFGLMLYGYPYISIFKAMAATRPLRLLSVLPGTAVILKSLETGWDLMLDVSGFLFFFMFLFAMLGLISFRGVFSRQCYFFPDGSDQAALVEPPMYCSGYYNGTTIVGPFDITIQANTYPGYQGLICPHGQQCIADPSNNPNNGYMNYDMIFSALLNVYTFVSMELWTDMMYLTQDADSRLAALFYCIGVYIIGFILIYLLLAVITSAFARVRATSGSSSAFTKNRSSSSFTSLRHQHILQVLHPGEEDEESVRARNNTTEPSSSWAHVPQQPQKRNLNNHSTARSTLNQWKRWIVRWVQSKTFFYFGGGLVLLDTLFMCLRSVYASESMLDFLDNVETAMTFIFAIEIVIRMMGALNWLQFWSSFKNKFDLFLVIITCVIQLPVIQDHPAYMYLTIFQVLRMYRLFLCIPRLEKLLNAALGTGESVINVIIFLLWSTALFAPIFMQLFGGDFVGFMEPNDDRLRFDTFWQSFLALIMLYTSETWTGTLYDAMQSQSHGGAVYAGIAMCLYFAFARYIVAGLYIAVILENFELDDEYIRKYQFKHFIRERLAHQKEETATPYYQTIFRFLFGKTVDKQKLLSSTSSSASIQISRLPSNLTASLSKEDMRQLLLLTEQEQKSKKIDEVAVPKEQENSKSKRTTWMPKKISRFVGNVLFPDMENVHISKLNKGITNSDGADQGEEDYDMIVAEENRQARQFAKERSRPVKSLFLFSETNRIRRFCKRLVGSCRDGQAERQNGFNWFIMACVLVSILVVILDEPSTRKLELQQQKHLGNNLQQLVQQQTKTQIYEMIDFVMGIVFVVEMLLRVIADGLILPRRAYLRHAWNRLDFVVILLNFGTLFSNNDQLPRALGTVRSMRVLRLIRYFGGVRDVFIDLFHAFPLMMDAMLLTFLVMIPFSVYGVNIFGGRFYTCNDTEDPNVMTLGRAACVNEFVLNVGADDDYNLPILVPRTWQNPVMNLYSYDDFGVALRHVFSMTSTEGWVDSMFFAMSTPPENDMLPVFDWDSPMIYHSIFYVAFMIISHGTVQLFVGVIIEKFKQRSGITTLTFAQRQYVDLQRQLAELKPTMKVFRPSSRIRAWCYDLIGDRHSLFNKSMTIIVILNMVMIATEFYDEPDWLANLQDYAYLTFVIIYVLEVIIKMLGLGRKKWWKSKWNIYDACIAICSFSLVICRFVSPALWSLRAERYCLVFAAFRIGESVDALQTLYHTIGMAMPSIIRVSAVFMLVMCLFAMIFMEFFGLTKYGQAGSNNSNFRNYGNALLLLVRMTTGEGWNEVMMDYTYSAPNCVASSNYLDDDCGSANWAYFLFNFFYITCTHIFLNLFIAVIIANFEYTYETRSRFTLITKNDLRKFKHAWAEIDPEGTGFIKKEQVAKFFKHLTGRFQVSIYDQVFSIRQLQKLSRMEMDITSLTTNSRQHQSLHQRIPSYDSTSTKFAEKDNIVNDNYYNYHQVNRRLAQMDTVELEQRRKYYNLLYMEIVDAETSKGIAFSDVLHIMAFRFVDIERALTLHPLMDRLEKLDEFNKKYAAEKARGVFLTLIQRKRYLRQLWQKRNQQELEHMALMNDVPASPIPTHRFSSPVVPTITVENVEQGYHSPAHLSPRLSSHSHGLSDFTSGLSLENQYTSSPAYDDDTMDGSGLPTSIPLPSPSLPSSSVLTRSPYSTTTTNSNSASPLGSPLPSPTLSSSASHSWLLVDANAPISVNQAHLLMTSLDNNSWSTMLQEQLSP